MRKREREGEEKNESNGERKFEKLSFFQFDVLLKDEREEDNKEYCRES